MIRRRLFVSGGSGAAFGARLVQPNALAGVITTFTRSQVAATAAALATGGGGAWWTEFAADVPRFGGSAGRLMLGGQRTVINTRQRLIGGTGWTLTNATAATTTGPDGGAATANRLDEGVALGVHQAVHPSISYTSGVSYSFSVIVKAETCTTCQVGPTTSAFGNNAFQNFNLGTGTLGTGGLNVTNARIVDLGSGWFWCSFSAPATSTATGAALALNMTTSASAVRAENYTGTGRTMLAFWAWVEDAAPFASSATLAASEPNTATRGQDNLTWAFSTLFPSGVGTLLGSVLMPFAAPAGADHTILDLNDGTLNNRIRLRNVAGGLTLVAGRVIGGASTDATSIGSMTAGTLFRFGLTFDGTTITANFNGGTNQTVAGQPAGLTSVRAGNNSAGTAPMFGEMGYLDALPYAIPGANLPAAVLAIP
jgi:hypothetical protein